MPLYTPFGSTEGTITEGDDNRLSATNLLKVKQNPGAGEFSSVSTALSSITTNSSSNPFVIEVDPGIFIEPQLQMKSFVDIRGSGNNGSILTPANINQPFILGAPDSALLNLIVDGATGINGVGVYFSNSTFNVNQFRILDCFFGSNTILIKVEGNAVGPVTAIYGQNIALQGSANFTTGILVTNTTSNLSVADISGTNIVTVGSGTPPTDVIKASGSNSIVTIRSLSIVGGSTPVGTGLHLLDGASATISGGTFSLLDTAITTENSGSAPSLFLSGIQFSNCNTNIDIEHLGTTGNFTGYTEISKAVIPIDTPFFITNTDAHTVTVGSKGDDFTSINDALASITANSPTDQFIILVNPGTYVESQIVMKSYVSIQGTNVQSAILVPANPNDTFIIGADNSSLVNIVITGATGINGVGVQYTGGSDGASFLMKDCIFGDNTTFCYAQGNASHETIFILENPLSFPNVNFTTGFLVDSIGSVRSRFVINGAFLNTGHSISNPTDFILGHGDGAKLFLSSSFFIGPFSSPAGNAIDLYDGADFTVVGSNFINMDKLLWAQNIGDPPNVAIEGIHTDSNNQDMVVDHPGTTGSISAAFETANSVISSSSLSVFTTDPTDGITFTGDLTFGATFDTRQKVTDLVLKTPGMGLISGGALTEGSGFVVNVSAGSGYCVTNVDTLQYVTWNNTSITLAANANDFIFFNNSGILSSSSGEPDNIKNIILGRVVTDGVDIAFIDPEPNFAYHSPNLFDNFNREAIGPLFASGSLVSENATPRQLDITQGTYFYSENKITPEAGTAITWTEYYRDGSGGWTTIDSQNTVPNNVWDDGSGTLASVTSGYYTKHLLLQVNQGSELQRFLVIAQAQYVDENSATTGNLPNVPSFFSDSVVRVASFVVQEGTTNILEILDERPRLGFVPSSVAGVTSHDALTDLTHDDHPQYLLTNGGRVLTGNLDLGNNSIINVNLVDGVNVPAHETRHLPNGADPLTTAAPTTNLSNASTNSVGIQNSLARSDHSHAITTSNLTDVGTDGITITGGTSAVFGSGTAISQHVADTTHNGYLSSTDWNTFNEKQSTTLSIRNVTATYTILSTDDDLVRCNGTFTVNLPVSTGSGKPHYIKNIGTGTITVTPNGTDTIDGQSSFIIASQYSDLQLVDGAVGSWDIL